MSSRKAMIVAVSVSLLAIGLPTGAALYLAYHQSMQQASSQSMEVAADALGRAEAVAEQAQTAVDRLTPTTTADPCSAARQLLMLRTALDLHYVKAVGYIVDTRVLCSSGGTAGAGDSLGPVAFVSPSGIQFRPAVDLGTGKQFVVLQQGHLAVAIDPESLLDIRPSDSAIAFGTYIPSQGNWLRGHGEYRKDWASRLGSAHAVTFFDGDNLVSIIRSSSRFDVAAYAAIPVSDLHTRLRESAVVLVPIGAILGLAAMLALMHLARQRTSMPAMLRLALKKREFALHYQPIVALDSGRMVGAEALLRWQRRDGSGMRPNVFIPAAEDCGLIHRLTEYVIRTVAIEAPSYFRQHPDAYISINLSSTDLHDEHTVVLLRELLQTRGIEARNVLIEVTEHSFINPELANRAIAQVRAMGIRVAIDDFGTGFSSLSHLNNLSADYLKIDKVFVDAIGTDSVTSEVVLHIIDMAKSLNLTLVSEGVETEEQAAFLRGHGVGFAQGWLYSKAKPMAVLLAEQKPD
ncbi:EAL domain-containing protein [Rhodanobacter sp. AS-Z3]|uniref:EAL domain-containing protein n=1 Tax=Rhodanobacter sp. AS-Z3 TaxID=3031330 RepID=UPI00247A4C6D|nr:EAL domain-containing protein [Rhodanobacter sp. AS-Z3]WEN15682.1 EAL domain-containing protein [Rhodanobacter sp. AS-Z3]